ncbi:MAG: invasion associated locus B family protein [Bauldia sp.]
MHGRTRWRAAVAASALALSPVVAAAPSYAQEAAPAAPAVAPATAGGWNKFCQTQGEREICSVVFQIVADGGQFIAQAALNQETGTGQILLSIMVRTGLLIQPGIQVQIDNNSPTAVPILLCDTSICISETQVDANFVNALKAGGTLTLSTLAPDNNQPNGARQNNFPMTLVGFTATYDGPGMTPDQAQARQDELNQALQDRAAAARQRLIEQQQQATTPGAAPATPAAPPAAP